jgi:hypothetical protein
MALAIAWRNPNPVQTTKRCMRFGEGIPTDIYLVQERTPGRTNNSGPICVCWKYFAVERLKLLVSQIMQAMNHEQPETKVTGQQQQAG